MNKRSSLFINNHPYFLIKATKLCNLNCRYCYAKVESTGAADEQMSIEVLDCIVRRIFECNDLTGVTFGWHAGEPLLRGINFFSASVNKQKTYNKDNIKVWNSIQTNGTLIKREWCEFFKKYHFDIGVSVDGPTEVHNKNRVYKNGLETFSAVMKGLDHLKEYKIGYGILTVISKTTLKYSASELLKFLNMIANGGSLAFLIESGVGTNKYPSLNDAQETLDTFKNFIKEVIDIWGASKTNIREFTNLVKMLKTGRGQICYQLRDKCIGKFLTIDSNGDIYLFCTGVGGVFNAPRFKNFCLGNVLDNSFKQMMRSSLYEDILDEVRKGVCRCEKECEYFKICHGGCPIRKYCETMRFDSTEHLECKYKQILFKNFIAYLNST